MIFDFFWSNGLPYMEIMTTTSTDPVQIAAAQAFNWHFSAVFFFGMVAFLFGCVVKVISRS